MRIGMHLNYAGGFTETVTELADYEKAGLNIVFVPEAYSYDAVSQLGFIAAKTERLEIASGIFQLYSRTPALMAMTAAGLDYVSGGRFTLGIGASGPQVVEGFHGVPYTAPLARTREVVDICRSVWRREPLEHDGPQIQIWMSFTSPMPSVLSASQPSASKRSTFAACARRARSVRRRPSRNASNLNGTVMLQPFAPLAASARTDSAKPSSGHSSRP